MQNFQLKFNEFLKFRNSEIQKIRKYKPKITNINSIFLGFIFLFSIKSYGQTSSDLFINLVPTTTNYNLNSGSIIDINLNIDPNGLPYFTGVQYIQVVYSIKYILKDVINGNEFDVGTDNLYANGWNYTTINGWTYSSTLSSVVIPSCIPSGNYTLNVKPLNAEFFTITPPNGYDDPGLTIQNHYYPFGSEIGSAFYPNTVSRQMDIKATNIQTSNLEVCEDVYLIVGGNSNCRLNNIANVTLNNTANVLSDVNISTTNSNCMSSNGSATATPINGTGPFSYNWFLINSSGLQTSIGQTTQTATNLSVGQYAVTVTDNGSGCSFNSFSNGSDPIVISYPYNITAPITAQNSCTYDEGTAGVVPTGGVAPYSYQWSTGQTTQSITRVPVGTHSVYVQDANGCNVTSTFTNVSTLSASDFDYPNGLTITSATTAISDLTGDGKIRIRGLVTINPGVNYVMIGKNIQFARDQIATNPNQDITSSGIIVSERATLTANNCVFRSVDNCNAMWQGIQVWGDDNTASKDPIVSALQTVLIHGRLNLSNSSIIDAHIGVACYKVNPGNLPNQKDHGRGLLIASNSTFLNNNISVAFRAKTLLPNNSTITRCTFRNNAALKDLGLYGGSGMKEFIQISTVRNPQITANSFHGHTGFPSENRGTGIRSYEAGYRVQSGGVTLPTNPPIPNVFNNLTQGIDAYSMGGAMKTVRIRDNRFNNVLMGVTASGTILDEISFNVFQIPAGTASFNTWGLNAFGSSGYLATENSFITTTTNPFTYGSISRNTQPVMGEVYKNFFTGNFFAASQMEQNNTNLRVFCNDYFGDNIRDWSITSGNLANQGDCASLTGSASNNFPTCISSDQSQIFKDPSAQNFTYSSSNPVPVCVSPGVMVSTCSQNNMCLSRVLPTCPSCTIDVSMLGLDNTPVGPELERLRAEVMRELAALDDPTQLIAFITDPENGQSPTVVIPTLIDQKQCAEARALVNTLDQNSLTYLLYNVLTTICETGRTPQEITLSEQAIVEFVSQSSEQIATNAEAFLLSLTKGLSIRIPERTFPVASGLAINTNNSESSESAKMAIVYPNPSEGELNVQFSEALFGEAKIVDALGRTIALLNFDGINKVYSIQNVPSGFYTLLIFDQNGLIETHSVQIKN